MSLVIMTKRCYLVCESVSSIILEETERGDSESKFYVPKFLSKKRKLRPVDENAREWTIEINYTAHSTFGPKSGTYAKSGADEQSISVTVTGTKEANLLYKEIIKEIQEQCPDILFLDQLVDRILNQEPAS